jgi:opacity protein-like surface antigen
VNNRLQRRVVDNWEQQSRRSSSVIRMRMTIVAFALMGASAVTNAAESGFYTGAAIGQTESQVARSDGIAGRATFISMSTDDDDYGWSALLGYRVNPYFAGELTYIDFGSVDVTETYMVSIPLLQTSFTMAKDFSLSFSGAALSVLGSLPLGEHLDVFARGGVLFADQEVDRGPYILPSTETYRQEIWIAGVGLDWSFAPRWSLRLEYQRTDDVDANATSGESRLEHFALGVGFRL